MANDMGHIKTAGISGHTIFSFGIDHAVLGIPSLPTACLPALAAANIKTIEALAELDIGELSEIIGDNYDDLVYKQMITDARCIDGGYFLPAPDFNIDTVVVNRAYLANMSVYGIGMKMARKRADILAMLGSHHGQHIGAIYPRANGTKGNIGRFRKFSDNRLREVVEKQSQRGNISLETLSNALGTSPGTVSRHCKKLGITIGRKKHKPKLRRNIPTPA